MLARQLATSTEDNPQQQLAIIGSLSRTIEESVGNSIPVQVLFRGGATAKTVEQVLALMISKAASMLSVGGNLRPEHPMEIAKMLISEFPLYSLDDFQIMLQRGVTGKYGKIIRFDVSVIFGWMQEYMIEWADTKEKLEKKKSTKPQEPSKVSDKTKIMVDEFMSGLHELKKVPSLTTKEIWENGKERPKKKIAKAPVREEFIVGDLCELCAGQGCEQCSGLGKVNAIKVHAESQDEADRMYELSKKIK